MESEFQIDLGEIKGFRIIMYITIPSPDISLASSGLPATKSWFEEKEEQ